MSIRMQEELSLSLDRQWVPQPLGTSPASALVFTNMLGQEFLCSLEEEERGAGGPLAKDRDAIPLHLYDSELLSAKLGDACSTLVVGYWSYEWCHRKGVSQYHAIPSRDGADARKPEMSLGRHSSSSFSREREDNANMSAAITRLVDVFEKGQWCDAAMAPRRSEVHIQCCDNLPELHKDRKLDRYSGQVAFLADIAETETCSYQLTVCSKLMCHPKVSEPPPAEVTLQSVLKDLLGRCVSKQEDWWTYEICFGKSTRQFRVQAVQDDTPIDVLKAADAADRAAGTSSQSVVQEIMLLAKTLGMSEAVKQSNDRLQRIQQVAANAAAAAAGKPKPRTVMKVVSEFMLGTRAPDAALDEDALYASVVYQEEGMAIDLVGKKKNNSMASVLLDYSNGTACDLKDATRSSRVELICGAGLGYQIIAIIDIIEDSTCHYLFKVSVPSLCEIDIFAPIEKTVAVLDCIPMEGDEGGDGEEKNVYDARNVQAEYKDLDWKAKEESSSSDSNSDSDSDSNSDSDSDTSPATPGTKPPSPAGAGQATQHTDSVTEVSVGADGGVQEETPAPLEKDDSLRGSS
jgi:hypothetical protein